jgi:hypothetical protein
MEGKPAPPEVLAEYVVEALDRQTPEKLEAVEEHARELRAYKREVQERDMGEDDIVDDPDVVDVDETEGEGYIVKKWQKCGADCECNDGKGHGPYKWRVTPDGNGGQNWKCLGPVSDGG